MSIIPHDAEFLKCILFFPRMWKLFLFWKLCIDKAAPPLWLSLDVFVKAAELVHHCKCLDGSPSHVADEIHRWGGVWRRRKSQKKVQFDRVNWIFSVLKKGVRVERRRFLLTLFMSRTWKVIWAVNISLSHSNKPLVVYWNTMNVIESVRFWTLFVTSLSIAARWKKRKIIAKWKHSVEYLDCNIKYNAEGFEAELIHGIDPVQVVEDEVKQRSSCSTASVKLSCLQRQ